MTRPSASSALIGRVSLRSRDVGEPQVAVGIVLDDQHLLASAPVEQRAALGERQDAAGGVLEIRDDVQELDATPRRTLGGEHRVEMCEIETVGLLPDADQARPRTPERRDRSGERRQLDEHDIARIHEEPRDQIDGLLRAGGEQNLVARARDALRAQSRHDRLDQGAVAPRLAVLQRVLVPASQQVVRDVAVRLPGERRRIRVTRRERDQVRPARGEDAHLANRRTGELRAHARERRLLPRHAGTPPGTIAPSGVSCGAS